MARAKPQPWLPPRMTLPWCLDSGEIGQELFWYMPKMSQPSTGTLPALGAIAVLSLGLAACGTLDGATAPRAQVTLHVADVAMSSGAPGLALRVAALVLARQPNNADALRARGDALYALGQIEPAAGSYRAAIRIDPKLAAAQIGLGRTLIRTDPRAAEAAFLAASALQPGNVAALSNLGVARDMQNHHAVAQEAYRAALALSPDMADVRVNLGLSLALSGRAEQAVQILRPLVSDPGATQLWHADLAVALAQSGDLAGARRALAVPGDAAPETDTAAAAPADAPVVAPAPLVAVTQRDVPAPGISAPQAPPAIAAPPAIEALRITRKPSLADLVPNPFLAAMTTVTPETEAAPPSPVVATPSSPSVAAPPSRPVVAAPFTPVAAAQRLPVSPPAPGVALTAPVPPAATPVAAKPAVAPEPASLVVATTPAAAPPVAAGRPAPLHTVVATSQAPVPSVHADVPSVHAAVSPDNAAVPAPPMVVAAAAIPRPPAADRSVPAPGVVSHVPAPVPPATSAASDAPTVTHAGGTPWLQLAAVRSASDVPFEWHRLQARLPDLLAGRNLTVSQGEANDHPSWRLRTGGFASLADANALCLRIRMVGGKCLAVISSGT
jgi:Flp pilus assembly protein TadD